MVRWILSRWFPVQLGVVSAADVCWWELRQARQRGAGE